MKSILRFLAILAVGVGMYFFQDGLPADLPFFNQKGQAIETQIKYTTKTESVVVNPVQVGENLIASTKDAAILTRDGVIESTNQERLSSNLKSLVSNSQLNMAAQAKLDDMFTKQYFQHGSPDGYLVDHFILSAGYKFSKMGENLALGDYKDDTSLIAAWMASPTHRANILDSGYTEIGVAIKRGKINGEDTWLAVQYFGTPIQ